MEPITTAILARGIYDLLQAGLSFSKNTIKEKIKTLIKDDEVADSLSNKVEKLPLTDELSPIAIQRKFDEDPEIKKLLSSITAQSVVNLNQQHSGSGDNVGGNKIVNR